MNLQNKLDKGSILIRRIHYPNFLVNLKEITFKNEVLDPKILKGVGKGRWLLSSFLIKSNKINISSICSDRLLIKLLEEGLPSKKRFLIDMHLDFQFWKNNLNDHKEKKLIVDLRNVLKLEEKSYSLDSETGTFELKAKSFLTKKKLLNFLNSLLDKFQLKFPYILLKIKTKSLLLNISLEGNDLEIEGNFKEVNYLKHLNMLFFSKNKEVPSYCLWYAEVQKLKNGWSEKRKGILTQECGNDIEYQRKQYNF